MSNALVLASNKLPSTGSIEAYVQAANAFPILTQEQEIELATSFQEEGNLQAAEQLVLSHIRYVARIARNYSGYGLAFSDLVQEGTIGLMKAVKRFDPAMGIRLVSFAVHWIKSEIHDFVIRNWRIVKVATTKAQRKLFFNLRRNKKRLGWFTQEEVNQVAEDLGVAPKDVLEMESRLNAHDAAFDMISADDEGEESAAFAPAQYLSSSEHGPLEALEAKSSTVSHNQQLHLALAKLDTRSRDIVENRWLVDKKATLKALAEKYKVSIERVRQLEKSAMEKLRDNFEDDV